MAAHATVCQEVPPWRRREVARNTGRKCEKPSFPPSYREALRLDRKRQERASLRLELRET